MKRLSGYAKGGINYKSEGWEKTLQEMLPSSRPYLDAVIDGAGGDIVPKASRVLKQGGVICCNGMTVAPKPDFPMVAVLEQIDLRGSSAGS